MPNGSTNPIRALVFDTVTVSQVTYRIDGAGTWFPMTKNASNPNLWEGVWNASGLANGSHKIEVQAVGTTTRLDTINVTVAGTNSAPVAADDSYTTDQGTTLTVAAPGVLANDTDADGDALTASLVSGPAHGQLTLNANGSFGYIPAAGYSGPDSFLYAASDGRGGEQCGDRLDHGQGRRGRYRDGDDGHVHPENIDAGGHGDELGGRHGRSDGLERRPEP